MNEWTNEQSYSCKVAQKVHFNAVLGRRHL